MRFKSVAMAGVLLLAGAAIGAPPELIPREVFFGNPERTAVRLSPDGTRLSYLAERDGVLNVWVETIGAGDARPVTSSTVRPIRFYFWAWNDEQILYVQDLDGDENWRLLAVDIASGDEVDLTPLAGVQARAVATDRDHPDEVLVALNDRVPEHHDVYRVNTRTGERTLVFENTLGYVGFHADGDMTVRLATHVDRRGGIVVHARDALDDPWYELIRWRSEDTAMSGVLGLSRDGTVIYLRDSRDVDTAGLHAYAITGDGEGGATYEMLASDDRVDVGRVVFDPSTGRPQAVAFDHSRREWRILDETIRNDCALVASAAAGEPLIVSRDRSDMRWVVSFERDDGPTAYHLFDRAARETTFLFNDRPALEGLSLAKMEPVVIRSRDGLDLVSYLTVPRGVEARGLPMVLLVHGGPWARDRWGYRSLHQWLANRGYATLSVNFRGSSGFGKHFLNAGNGEWAGRMHDDLIDAVLWACDRGIADPDRVAIMGGSYGGYAALVGLTFTPEFFAAAVDIVGPSHVRTLLESIPPYWEPMRAMFEARVGRVDDTAFLDAISPLTRVDQIRRPLLIGQGSNDPRVKEAESRQIVDAMRDKGLPVTYLVFPDEGHGFARHENNMAFFAVTETFLAEHLDGRAEPIGSAVRESSAIVESGASLIPGLSTGR